MKEPSYGLAKALTVGTPNPAVINDLPVTGVLITATVAGNVVLQLAGGTQVTVNVPVGTTTFPLATIEVVSATATATYWQLA